MPLGAPAGYYQVPGLPYPGRPAIPQPDRSVIDPNDLLATAAAQQNGMGADAGIGTPPPRDPAMNALPRGTLSGAPGASPMTGDASVIRLAPNRTSPFSRADAQAMAALDPRVLEEAKGLAKLDTPKTMTATFGGKNFEMTPAARVDRNALARLYSQGQERKTQEQQAKVRGEEQAGKERLVAIPGQQATDRAKIEAEAKVKLAEADRIASAPERNARVEQIKAETAAAMAKTGQQAKEFSERATPAQTAADEEYNRIASSPFANTAEARAQMDRLRPFTTAGKSLPPDVVAGASRVGAPDSATIMAQVAEDPAVLKILEQINKATAGWSPNPMNRAATGNLARRLIREKLISSGLDPQSADEATQNIINNRKT